MSAAKLAAVQYVLNKSNQITRWYNNEHHVSVGDFSAKNVSEYGLGGLGELASQIIKDGETDGLFRLDDAAPLRSYLEMDA